MAFLCFPLSLLPFFFCWCWGKHIPPLSYTYHNLKFFQNNVLVTCLGTWQKYLKEKYAVTREILATDCIRSQQSGREMISPFLQWDGESSRTAVYFQGGSFLLKHFWKHPPKHIQNCSFVKLTMKTNYHSKFLYFLHVFIFCEWIWVKDCHSTGVEVRGQLLGISHFTTWVLRLRLRFWGLMVSTFCWVSLTPTYNLL